MPHDEYSLRELGLKEIRRLATTRGIKRTVHGKEKQNEVLIRDILEQHVSHDTHSQSTDGSPSSSAAGIAAASVDPPPSLDHAEDSASVPRMGAPRRLDQRDAVLRMDASRRVDQRDAPVPDTSALRRPDVSGGYSE